MSTVETVSILAGIGVLILLSAFFSGSETALFSLKPPLLRRWGKEGNSRQKRAALLMTEHHETLVAILFGTNLVNILISVGVNRVAGGMGVGPSIAALTATVILLIFGEVTPKTIAYGKSAWISERIAPIIWWMKRLLHPAIVVLSGISKAFLKVLGPPPNRKPLSVEEFQTFITIGANMSAFSAKEAELLREIFALRDNTVAEAMIPRVDLCSVDASWSPAKVEDHIRQHRHRRLAVVDGSLDDLIGVLDVRRYYQSTIETRETWDKSLVVEPHFVPEHASLEKALNILRETAAGMVFVVDEYGGIAGLLTMEDLLEEIVGELNDEYDVPLWQSGQLTDNGWRFTGMVSLLDLEDEVEFITPEGTISDTVSGLIAEALGRIPMSGDEVTVGNGVFTVRSVVHKRVAEFDVNGSTDDARRNQPGGGIMITAIVITVVCLLASACFSGFENGMLAIRRAKLNHAAEEGKGSAVLMRKFLDHPGLMLGTILLGNNLANVYSATYFDEIVKMTLGSSVLYSTIAAVLLTFCVLVFGEISPKVWFRQAPMKRCGLLIYPMYALYVLFLPIVRALNAIAKFVERLFASGTDGRSEVGLVREEFRTFVMESGRAGSLDPDAARLLDSALGYTGQTAGALMTPLELARTMPTTLTLREAVKLSEDLGTSRFPIVRPNDSDGRWIGLFSVYDAIFAVPPERWDDDTVADHFRPLITISEDAGIDLIFKRAHATRTPLLAVLGENKIPIGIISVRDVLKTPVR